MNATEKIGEVTKRRPAETKAGALGAGAILLISLLEAFGVEVTGAWLKVITGVVAFAAAAFTWLFANGGIRGVLARLLGQGQTPDIGAGPQAAA